MTTNWTSEALAKVREANIKAGLCPDCGGAGEVFDVRAITRTGDPHARGRRCRTCRGTGKLEVKRGSQTP